MVMMACMETKPRRSTNQTQQKPIPAADLGHSLKARLDRPLALVGLMGSGKSAVGQRTARMLGLNFEDSDKHIVKNAGISIAEIFELAGEAKFREMELKTIRALLSDAPQIVATGGGAFCHETTARLLLETALVVWLKAPPETLLSRIGNTKSRPLLHNDDPLATLTRLNQQRSPHYEKAHIHLDTDGLSTHKAMMALLHALDSHLPRQ